MGIGETTHAPSGERNRLIDSLRAMALFGVIAMNLTAMVMRFLAEQKLAQLGTMDIVAAAFDLIFLQGKARACFAFLFGVGFGILMVRAADKGGDFRSFYLRRMLALLAFGLVNQAFLFWGDILVLYALLGMLLLAVRDWSDRAVLRAGLALVVAPPLIAGLLDAIGSPIPNILPKSALDDAAGLQTLMSGSYLAAVGFNFPQTLLRYATNTQHMIVYATSVLGLFMLGLWTARQRIPFAVEAHRPLLRRIALICIPLGLALSLVHALDAAGVKLHGVALGAVTAAFVGLPVLAFGYMTALSLLFARRAAGLQALLAPAGRMALTNYLLSGLVGGWIFYGWGLGLAGRFNMASLTLLAAALFAALILLSHAWLSLFRFGPAEWLWRALSYGKLPPLLRERLAAAGA